MSKKYDLICIGGGSGGFNAARVAADLGKSVAIVDDGKPLGGLCILRGCMPSKTLLYSAEILHLAQKGKVFGLKIPRASADMKAIHRRKREIIADFAQHREKQLKSGRFDLYQSRARFVDSQTLQLADGRELTAKKFLIATGSKVAVPSIPGLAEAKAWTSDDVLEIDFIPKSVIVLGGGIVACELAQFLKRIGSDVTLIQRSPNILRDHSDAASGVIAKAFSDEGIKLHIGTKIQAVRRTKSGFSVTFVQAGKTVTKTARYLFNALGRNPNTDALGLGAAGVEVRENGQIITNRWQQTSAPHIYSAGDCCGPHEIVHIAVQQGEIAARHAFGIKNVRPVDNALLLNVVFTDPQLATIGVLERELIEGKKRFLHAVYPFNDHGKSILMDANYGYVKVLADPQKGRILGAEIVGKDAGELIHCFSTALAMRATVFDMLRAPWYHPTLSEIITYPLEEIADKLKS